MKVSGGCLLLIGLVLTAAGTAGAVYQNVWSALIAAGLVIIAYLAMVLGFQLLINTGVLNTIFTDASYFNEGISNLGKNFFNLFKSSNRR
jgi:hypothetical protein